MAEASSFEGLGFGVLGFRVSEREREKERERECSGFGLAGVLITGLRK